MKIWILRIFALILVPTGIVVAILAIQKDITLVVDGKNQNLKTYAITVSQMLKFSGVSLASEDRLSPPANHWLNDGDTVNIERAAQVTIRADNKNFQLHSPDILPANLLALASIPLFPEDRLLADGTLILPDRPLDYAPAHSLQVRRAIPITIQENGQTREFSSAATTLGEALWEAGIRVYNGDHLTPVPQTYLTALGMGINPSPLVVQLVRAHELTIRVDGHSLHVRSAATRVGEALAENGLSLQGLDYSIPPENNPLPLDNRLRVVRVQENVYIEHRPLEFGTDYLPAPELEIDKQKLLQAGEYGLTAQRVRVRYEDGQEVSRQVEDKWVARKPQNRQVGYGTKIVLRVLNTPDGSVRYWRALRMWATSYHPSAVGGDVTATGKKVRKGLVAINPQYIPYGTRMYVPGYGPAEAADTGNLPARWIDLGYADEEYVSWHQWVTVYFLWPPPENIVWIIP